MEEVHNGTPEGHLLSSGGGPTVAPLDRPRAGLLTPFQPPNVGHTFGVRHHPRVDTLQKGDALGLPRHFLGHGVSGRRRSSTLRLRKGRTRESRPTRPAKGRVGPGTLGDFPEQPPIVERSKRTCKAIAPLQLFSLREFDGSRTQSLKVPRVPPRRTAAGALPKSNATYVCRAHLALPSNKGT